MPSLAINERRTQMGFHFTRVVLERKLCEKEWSVASLLEELRKRRHSVSEIQEWQRGFALQILQERIRKQKMATAQEEAFMKKFVKHVREGLREDFDGVREAISKVDARVTNVGSNVDEANSRLSTIESSLKTIESQLKLG